MAKIMIVDDAAAARNRLRRILEAAGHEVFEVTDSMDLLTQYPRLCPDVVTMDIIMPEMDGVQLTERLLGEYPGARVVVVSAMGTRKILLKALSAGALCFITKPFEEEVVLSTIDAVLNADGGNP